MNGGNIKWVSHFFIEFNKWKGFIRRREGAGGFKLLMMLEFFYISD